MRLGALILSEGSWKPSSVCTCSSLFFAPGGGGGGGMAFKQTLPAMLVCLKVEARSDQLGYKHCAKYVLLAVHWSTNGRRGVVACACACACARRMLRSHAVAPLRAFISSCAAW